MRYRCEVPGSRSEPPRVAVRSCGITAPWDELAGTASVAGIREDRAVRVERKRMKKGGSSRGRACWARATEPGERFHPSSINHK